MIYALIFLDIYLKIKLLGHRYVICSTLVNIIRFWKWLDQFTPLPTVYNCSSWSIILSLRKTMPVSSCADPSFACDNGVRGKGCPGCSLLLFLMEDKQTQAPRWGGLCCQGPGLLPTGAASSLLAVEFSGSCNTWSSPVVFKDPQQDRNTLSWDSRKHIWTHVYRDRWYKSFYKITCSWNVSFTRYYFCYTGCTLISSILFYLRKKITGWDPVSDPQFTKIVHLVVLSALSEPGVALPAASHLAPVGSELWVLAAPSIQLTCLMVFARGALLWPQLTEAPCLTAPSAWSGCSARLMKLCPELVELSLPRAPSDAGGCAQGHPLHSVFPSPFRRWDRSLPGTTAWQPAKGTSVCLLMNMLTTH